MISNNMVDMECLFSNGSVREIRNVLKPYIENEVDDHISNSYTQLYESNTKLKTDIFNFSTLFNGGKTALHLAVIGNNFEVCAFLLRFENIDTNIKDETMGFSAVEYAILNQNADLAILIHIMRPETKICINYCNTNGLKSFIKSKYSSISSLEKLPQISTAAPIHSASNIDNLDINSANLDNISNHSRSSTLEHGHNIISPTSLSPTIRNQSIETISVRSPQLASIPTSSMISSGSFASLSNDNLPFDHKPTSNNSNLNFTGSDDEVNYSNNLIKYDYPDETHILSWGSNSNFVLGQNDSSERLNPEPVDITTTYLKANGTLMSIQNFDEYLPLVKKIKMSKYHTAILTDKYLLMNGVGSYGRLGLGHTDVVFRPTIVKGFKRPVEQVELGTDHTLAITSKGELYSWGSNKYGQLGHSNLNNEPEGLNNSNLNHCVFPREISSLKKITILGCTASKYHSAAFSDTGALYTWGSNNGQLGYECDIQKIPKKVTCFPQQKILQLASTKSATAVLTGNYQVYVFSKNTFSKVKFGLPKEVLSATGIDNIKEIVSGNHQFAALTEGGYVFMWSPPENEKFSKTWEQVNFSQAKPKCVWSARSKTLRAKNIAIGIDSNLLICTETNHVYFGTKRKEIKYKPRSSYNIGSPTPNNDLITTPNSPNGSGYFSYGFPDMTSDVIYFKFVKMNNLCNITGIAAGNSGAYMVIKQNTRPSISILRDMSMMDDILNLFLKSNRFPSLYLPHNGDRGSLNNSDNLNSKTSIELGDIINLSSAFRPDVVFLLADGKQIFAHKCILSFFSKYLKDEIMIHDRDVIFPQIDGKRMLSTLKKTKKASRKNSQEPKTDPPSELLDMDTRYSTLKLPDDYENFSVISLPSFHIEPVYAVLELLYSGQLSDRTSGIIFGGNSIFCDQYYSLRKWLKVSGDIRWDECFTDIVNTLISVNEVFKKKNSSISDLNFADTFIILSEQKYVVAHSKIISSRSFYFSSLFNDVFSLSKVDANFIQRLTKDVVNQDDLNLDCCIGMKIINLENYSYETFSIILKYIYGQSYEGFELFKHIEKESHNEFMEFVIDVLKCADELLMEGLKDICSTVLCRLITHSSYLSILNIADIHTCSLLRKSILNYFFTNLESMIKVRKLNASQLFCSTYVEWILSNSQEILQIIIINENTEYAKRKSSASDYTHLLPPSGIKSKSYSGSLTQDLHSRQSTNKSDSTNDEDGGWVEKRRDKTSINSETFDISEHSSPKDFSSIDNLGRGSCSTNVGYSLSIPRSPSSLESVLDDSLKNASVSSHSSSYKISSPHSISSLSCSFDRYTAKNSRTGKGKSVNISKYNEDTYNEDTYNEDADVLFDIELEYQEHNDFIAPPEFTIFSGKGKDQYISSQQKRLKSKRNSVSISLSQSQPVSLSNTYSWIKSPNLIDANRPKASLDVKSSVVSPTNTLSSTSGNLSFDSILSEQLLKTENLSGKSSSNIYSKKSNDKDSKKLNDIDSKKKNESVLNKLHVESRIASGTPWQTKWKVEQSAPYKNSNSTNSSSSFATRLTSFADSETINGIPIKNSKSRSKQIAPLISNNKSANSQESKQNSWKTIKTGSASISNILVVEEKKKSQTTSATCMLSLQEEAYEESKFSSKPIKSILQIHTEETAIKAIKNFYIETSSADSGEWITVETVPNYF